MVSEPCALRMSYRLGRCSSKPTTKESCGFSSRGSAVEHCSGPLTASGSQGLVSRTAVSLVLTAHLGGCAPVTEILNNPAKPPVLLLTLVLSLQGSEAASKGDFLFSSDHLIEMATKLYRTTLSQTKQKLNIEISDEYVHALCSVAFGLRVLLLQFGSPVLSNCFR